MKKGKNTLFYLTTTEITYGTIHQQNWGPVFQEMTQKYVMVANLLAADVLPKFLNSKIGMALIMSLRKRELAGESNHPLKTVGAGLDRSSDTYWLDMFRVMSETGACMSLSNAFLHNLQSNLEPHILPTY